MAMDVSTLGLIMIVIGVLLFLMEASAPGFFVAIPGTALIVLGMLALAAPGLFNSWWSPIIAVISAVVTMIIILPLYQRLAPPELPTTTVGLSLIGKIGQATREIDPENIKGKVKIENQIWSATSSRRIPEGRKVKVIDSKGVHVIVTELKTTKLKTTSEKKGGE